MNRRKASFSDSCSYRSCEFGDLENRRVYMTKVYSLLFLCWCLILLLVALCFHMPDVNDIFAENAAALWITFGVVFLLVIVMTVCLDCWRDTFPSNLILLTILVACITVFLCLLMQLVDPLIIYLCCILITVCVLLIAILTILYFFEITTENIFVIMIISFLAVALTAFLVTRLFHRDVMKIMLYAIIGFTLYMLYLVLGTYLLMTGQHEDVSICDVVLGTIVLFVELFILVVHCCRAVCGI